MANILDIILNTIKDVQRKNEEDPNIETVDPSVFDLLRREINKIDKKFQKKQANSGKNTKSIFDMVKDGIEGVRKENKKDPNVQTAPKSVFKELVKKVDKQPQKYASSNLKEVIENYNLDLSELPKVTINQIQTKYAKDLKQFNHQYAAAINDLIRQARGR